MSRGRFTIGIDLGTTNSALAYLDTQTKGSSTQILPLPQLEEWDRMRAHPILPSFIFLSPERDNPVVGRMAREQASRTPGRVVHSAKSWLSYSQVDREAKLLPWGAGANEIPAEKKISPVEASQHYLSFLKQCWENAHEEAPFCDQDITITVPASFDESAQSLTLRAAEMAGYPSRVRLMEEPQAAFYAWLESRQHESVIAQSLKDALPNLGDFPNQLGKTILVCDIGGGTTDFSLFEITLSPKRIYPNIKRLLVGEHLLLGGDNIDLALARQLESRLVSPLSRRQWQFLSHAARDLKERALNESNADASEVLHVSVAGEGRSLIASTQTATITRGEIVKLVLDGFFPLCERTSQPLRSQQPALREWGLPFASDTAVTRHASFLAGRDVHGVLFNGGTFFARSLRDRIVDAITHWQGHRPNVLDNPDLSLSVARGAAFYGNALRKPYTRISGGYRHAVYVEVEAEKSEKGAPNLVCVLPHGFESGRTLRIPNLVFNLVVNRPARFQLFYSNKRTQDQAGELVALTPEDFNPLPPLQTKLTSTPSSYPGVSDVLEIRLESSVSETGLLGLYCVAKENRWRLDFNLRNAETFRGTEERKEEHPGVESNRLKAAQDRISLFYGTRKIADLNDSPKNLKRELEKLLGIPRETWNLALLRALWSSLAPGVTRRVRSPAHESSWLYLAGFCLRPGFGAELDEFRMGELWRCFPVGIAFPKNTTAANQWWILWRRVAGGLTAEQQEALIGKTLGVIRAQATVAPEMVMLAGSLERISEESRKELGDVLVKRIIGRKVTAMDQYFWSLGRLSARVPLYAGAQAALSAETAADWVNKILENDKSLRAYPNYNFFLAEACRKTGDRARDIPEGIRENVIHTMTSSGATNEQIEAVAQLTEISEHTQAKLFGEALPLGLKLGPRA